MIVPKGCIVLVRPDKKEEKTQGGIILAETIRHQEDLASTTGVILAIGPDAWADSTPRAKVGDRVMFSKYGGLLSEDPDTKEPYRLLNDVDIYCTIEEGAYP
jgi:co-chaperonin GroES (HSP10)